MTTLLPLACAKRICIPLIEEHDSDIAWVLRHRSPRSRDFSVKQNGPAFVILRRSRIEKYRLQFR